MNGLDQLFFKYCVYYPTVLLQGEKVHSHLRCLNDSQWADPTHLKEIQHKKLRALLAQARSNIPYYRQTLRDIDVEPTFSQEQLPKLPFISKKDLQANQHQFVQAGSTARLKRKTTGGTTGQPVFIWKTMDAIAQENAAN